MEQQDGNLQSDLSLATNQVSVCVCMRVTVQAQGRGRSGFATFTAAQIRGGGQLEGSMAYIAAGHMGRLNSAPQLTRKCRCDRSSGGGWGGSDGLIRRV